jgi:hypothetical protein
MMSKGTGLLNDNVVQQLLYEERTVSFAALAEVAHELEELDPMRESRISWAVAQHLAKEEVSLKDVIVILCPNWWVGADCVSVIRSDGSGLVFMGKEVPDSRPEQITGYDVIRRQVTYTLWRMNIPASSNFLRTADLAVRALCPYAEAACDRD